MSLKRKIIYIEIDEEINSIFDRVKKAKEKEVMLVIPSKALLFQSILNLKILKTKAEDLGKNIVIVTKDARGTTLCRNVELKVVASIKDTDESVKIKINAIDAYKNEVVEETPRRRDFTKVSISELLTNVSKKIKNKKAQLQNNYNFYEFTFKKPNRKGLIALVFLSMALFFFISYIALPGATIYILPKSDVVETGINLELADEKLNQRALEDDPPYMLATNPLETVFEKKMMFKTLSNVFEGTNAHGKIKVINTSDQEMTFKGKTRFQTPDGLVFRSQSWVTVSRRQADGKPGTAWVEIEADEYDIYKQAIGDRGNIKPMKLILPGLTEYQQKYIWGEVENPLQGGVTKLSQMVQKEDLDAAQKKIENEILNTALKDFEDYIQQQNDLKQTTLVLFQEPQYIRKEILEMRLPKELVGKKVPQFEVYAKIKVSGIVYDEIAFKQILQKNLLAKVHPDMQLQEINYDNLGYDIIEENKVLKIIKISITVNGREEFTVDTKNESGLRFVTKIKNAVLGMSVKDAENYIANLREVSGVKISTWPFFSSKMPGLPENIAVEVMEE